jgi:hypothetical protein
MSKPTTWMLVLATLAGIGISACKPNADTEQPPSQQSAPSYQQQPATPPSTSGTMSSPSDSEKQDQSDQGTNR